MGEFKIVKSTKTPITLNKEVKAHFHTTIPYTKKQKLFCALVFATL